MGIQIQYWVIHKNQPHSPISAPSKLNIYYLQQHYIYRKMMVTWGKRLVTSHKMKCFTLKVFFSSIGNEWCSLDASVREPRESDKVVSLNEIAGFTSNAICNPKMSELFLILLKSEEVFIPQVCYESLENLQHEYFARSFLSLVLNGNFRDMEVPSSMKINLS